MTTKLEESHTAIIRGTLIIHEVFLSCKLEQCWYIPASPLIREKGAD